MNFGREIVFNHGIMVTADAKSFDGGLCGVGANVLFDRIVEDDSKTDVFGDHPRMRVAISVGGIHNNEWSQMPTGGPIYSLIFQLCSLKVIFCDVDESFHCICSGELIRPLV